MNKKNTLSNWHFPYKNGHRYSMRGEKAVFSLEIGRNLDSDIAVSKFIKLLKWKSGMSGAIWIVDFVYISTSFCRMPVCQIAIFVKWPFLLLPPIMDSVIYIHHFYLTVPLLLLFSCYVLQFHVCFLLACVFFLSPSLSMALCFLQPVSHTVVDGVEIISNISNIDIHFFFLFFCSDFKHFNLQYVHFLTEKQTKKI